MFNLEENRWQRLGMNTDNTMDEWHNVRAMDRDVNDMTTTNEWSEEFVVGMTWCVKVDPRSERDKQKAFPAEKLYNTTTTRWRPLDSNGSDKHNVWNLGICRTCDTSQLGSKFIHDTGRACYWVKPVLQQNTSTVFRTQKPQLHQFDEITSVIQRQTRWYQSSTMSPATFQKRRRFSPRRTHNKVTWRWTWWFTSI